MNEILPSGQVLHLQSLSVPTSVKEATKEEANTETKDESGAAETTDSGQNGVAPNNSAEASHGDTATKNASDFSQVNDSP